MPTKLWWISWKKLQPKLALIICYETSDTDKIFLYVKDTFILNYQLLINRGQKVGIKQIQNTKTFIDNSQTIDGAHENQDYTPAKKRKVLIAFDDMVADM